MNPFGGIAQRNWVCPDVDELEISGSYGDEVFKYIKVEVLPCNSTVNECTNETEISQNLSFHTLKSIVDLRQKDEQDMITYISDKQEFLQLETGVSNKMNLYYKHSEIQLEDSPFKIFGE